MRWYVLVIAVVLIIVVVLGVRATPGEISLGFTFTVSCRGRKVYEPPRYMTVAQAASQLLEAVESRKRRGEALNGTKRSSLVPRLHGREKHVLSSSHGVWERDLMCFQIGICGLRMFSL